MPVDGRLQDGRRIVDGQSGPLWGGIVARHRFEPRGPRHEPCATVHRKIVYEGGVTQGEGRIEFRMSTQIVRRAHWENLFFQKHFGRQIGPVASAVAHADVDTLRDCPPKDRV